MTQRLSASPLEVWETLKAGNDRFATDTVIHPHSTVERRLELREGQAPVAAVLACSDSRVPVELLFDAGLGDMFVIRTAGGCVDAAVSGSVDFAVTALGVKLVIVLSHEACGAIGAAVTAVDEAEIPLGLQRVFVEKIAPSVIWAKGHGKGERGEIEREHARITAQHLIDRIPALQEGAADGSIGVVAARYSLAEGRVETVEEHFAR
ncbi:carbonic anhydrase [Corynebacterium liangguodongii]|uniref:Beta-hydroxylase n=1 Tax=Corynebacterium liangguodongii TaxID=2079535 RepID=A0A2S0WFV0_9CORY|nr:carbonic anhydrase [Corynebacterium liangguodongii]AWB84648.1 beta-hydroxylase [Corynebacterium liangguodongii]PWB99656.1 beta-hydroxylase [Corynebacterium liangguodongii]